jgi:3-hydroxyacyl-[acyl-carrier-protein] dehydratase
LSADTVPQENQEREVQAVGRASAAVQSRRPSSPADNCRRALVSQPLAAAGSKSDGSGVARMPQQPLYDFTQFNFDKPVFTLADIRRINPQRHEMEQLTAIVHIDQANHGIVGYKDVTEEEFWIAGHMPGFPLMPGVILCECAAQLASFYARKYELVEGDYLGFGGMEHVRFRSPVMPGCRLILMARVTRVRKKRRAEFEFQGFVGNRMVFSGEMIGVPISREQRIEA